MRGEGRWEAALAAAVRAIAVFIEEILENCPKPAPGGGSFAPRVATFKPELASQRLRLASLKLTLAS